MMTLVFEMEEGDTTVTGRRRYKFLVRGTTTERYVLSQVIARNEEEAVRNFAISLGLALGTWE